ncbi:hypothetical protein AgCh_002787 [Apium graveolens]
MGFQWGCSYLFCSTLSSKRAIQIQVFKTSTNQKTKAFGNRYCRFTGTRCLHTHDPNKEKIIVELYASNFTKVQHGVFATLAAELKGGEQEERNVYIHKENQMTVVEELALLFNKNSRLRDQVRLEWMEHFSYTPPTKTVVYKFEWQKGNLVNRAPNEVFTRIDHCEKPDEEHNIYYLTQRDRKSFKKCIEEEKRDVAVERKVSEKKELDDEGFEKVTKPKGQDMEELKQFAKDQGAPEADDLTHCTRDFVKNIIEEKLRPYFSLPKVMDGLFNLAMMLFGVTIESADGLAPVWNSDVKFYCVKDSSGSPIAYFYFDPYSRPSEKHGWMRLLLGAVYFHALSRDGASARLPVAHMVCNQMPPVGDKPSLMTFREVETLFHEFGHALQHMLIETR